MNNNKNTKTMGAYAPAKNRLFSTTVVEKVARMQLVSNAPPQQLVREIIRNRVRVD